VAPLGFPLTTGIHKRNGRFLNRRAAARPPTPRAGAATTGRSDGARRDAIAGSRRAIAAARSAAPAAGAGNMPGFRRAIGGDAPEPSAPGAPGAKQKPGRV
jgi:hypothetical protein